MAVYCIEHLAYAAKIETHGKIWVSNWRFNGLFSIENNRVVYEGRFAGHPDSLAGIHSYVKVHGDKLFFFPQKSNVIDIYDIKSKRFQTAFIDEWASFKNCAVIGVEECEEGFWIVPRYGKLPAVKLSYDGFITESIPIQSEKQLGLYDNDTILAISVCVVNKQIFIPVFHTSKIIQLDLKNGEESVYDLNREYHFHCIAKDENGFWISSAENVLYCDDKLNELCLYRDVIDRTNPLQKPAETAKILIDGDLVYVIPVWSGRVGVINKYSGSVRAIDLSSNQCNMVEDRIKNWRTFKEAEFAGGEIIIYPISMDSQIKISESGIQYTKLLVPLESVPPIDLSGQREMTEYSTDDLIFFLEALKKNKVMNRGDREKRKTIGTRIFEQCI